jgi:hypothetical protein
MMVDMKIVVDVLKGLKQLDMIDGYWEIKEAFQRDFAMSELYADELFGEPTVTGEIK